MLEGITLAQLTNEMIKIFALSVGAFVLAMALTPVYTFAAYRYRFWKRRIAQPEILSCWPSHVVLQTSRLGPRQLTWGQEHLTLKQRDQRDWLGIERNAFAREKIGEERFFAVRREQCEPR